jgi:tetratricopeptide (TPR) repeat protein
MQSFSPQSMEKDITVAAAHWKPLEEARILGRSGQDRETLMAYRNLLLLYPEAAEAWTDYGNLLLALNQVEGALNAYSKSLAIEPDAFPTLAGMGKALLKLGRLEEAESRLKYVLSLAPRLTEVRLDLARCRIKRGDLDGAATVLGPAIDQDPANPEVTSLLIYIFIRQENWPELQKEMLRRVNEDYSDATLDWERCCVNLTFGAMAEGWGQFESRWRLPGVSALERKFSQPLWGGEPFPGKTLLLHFEQGLGDTLMFVRYASRAKQLGGRIVLLAQSQLAELVATCPGVDQVVGEEDPLPPFDLHLPLLSLPGVFRTDLKSIPAEIPYLDVPRWVPNQQAIGEFLAGSHGRTRIGLAWAGSPTHARDAQRSISPEVLSPLRALGDVAWHTFQPGATELPPLPGIVSLAPLLNSFSDTAYALRSMDLLITVDTAVAHLAGALGVPTLLLVSYIPDWRWMMGRVESPWYPTIHLYRQPTPGDWDTVIKQVVEDLTTKD